MKNSARSWHPDALAYLDQQWPLGTPPAIIAAELTKRFGRAYTQTAVSIQATRRRLPARFLDLCGKDGEPIIRMRDEGLSICDIARSLRISPRAAAWRVQKMMQMGVLDSLDTLRSRRMDTHVT